MGQGLCVPLRAVYQATAAAVQALTLNNRQSMHSCSSACRTDSLERTRGVLAHGDDLVPGQHLADQIRLGRGFRIQQHVRQPRGDVLACQGKSQGLGSEDRDQAGSERAAHMTGSWRSDSVPQDAQYHR